LPIWIAIDSVRAARERIAGVAVRTPLVRLPVDSPGEVWLKLENLQPIGSFKIRGAANRLLQAGPGELAKGVWTASAGNMAQGVAYMARRLDVPCSVVIPDTAPATKRAAIERLGGRLVPVPHDEWFEAFRTRRHEGIGAAFVFPEMFALARELLAGSLVASLDEVAGAVRILAERARIVAEGAGAAPVAAALAGKAGGRTVVCVVSGGNIDSPVLAAILEGRTPRS